MPETADEPKISKRLWGMIFGLIVVTIALVAYSAKSLRDVAILAEKEIPVPNVPEIPQPKPSDFEDDEPEPSPTSKIPPKSSNGKPPPSEIPFALPVVGQPLMVTLTGDNASLGQISIEKYDSEGRATGEPLPQGTPVQIPDPNDPGEKIYFRVP